MQMLKKQSLTRLYKLLRLTSINGSTVQAYAVIWLAQFVYSETSEGPEWNMLRNMVSEYLACVSGKILAIPHCFMKFKETLSSHGDLAFDLIVVQSTSSERLTLQNFSPRTEAAMRMLEQEHSSEGRKVMETELKNYQTFLEVLT